MPDIINTLEKANMRLTGYGVNNTVFLTDSIKKVRELERQLTATQQALDKTVEALKWQPIKTAPKNGTSILIYDYDTTNWEELNDRRFSHGHDIMIANWCRRTNKWELYHRGGNYIYAVNPIYWMPLPSHLSKNEIAKAALASIKE